MRFAWLLRHRETAEEMEKRIRKETRALNLARLRTGYTRKERQ